MAVAPTGGIVIAMSDTLRYSHAGEDGIMAQVEEVPGAISQGRTRPEARENVIDRTAAHAQARTRPNRRPRPRAALSPAGVLKRRALERHLREHGAEVLEDSAAERATTASCAWT